MSAQIHRLQPRTVPPQEQVSRGLLRVSIFLRASAWFCPQGFLLKVVECVDTYVPLECDLKNEDEVKKMIESFREAAKARHLTFELHNHTDTPHADFGIQPEELAK